MNGSNQRNTVGAMHWKSYIDRLAATRSNTEIAKLAEVTPGNVTKWRNGTQGVDATVAIRLARAVGDSPLAVLVDLRFLTPAEAGFASEAGGRPYWEPVAFTNDELLTMVRARMIEKEGEIGGDTAATKAPPDDGGDVLKFKHPADPKWSP